MRPRCERSVRRDTDARDFAVYRLAGNRILTNLLTR
jgi:hypothetical protein